MDIRSPAPRPAPARRSAAISQVFAFSRNWEDLQTTSTLTISQPSKCHRQVSDNLHLKNLSHMFLNVSKNVFRLIRCLLKLMPHWIVSVYLLWYLHKMSECAHSISDQPWNISANSQSMFAAAGASSLGSSPLSSPDSVISPPSFNTILLSLTADLPRSCSSVNKLVTV